MQSEIELSSPGYTANAEKSEEITASWERDSDAILLGERVISDLRQSNKHGFAINAFCSPESFETIICIRKFVAGIISSVNSANLNVRGNRESIVAAEILSKAGRASITPLSQREKKLAETSRNLDLKNDIFLDTALSPDQIPVPEYASSAPGVTLPEPPLYKLRFCGDNNRKIKYYSGNLQCRKDRFDTEFVDLFRLFLYVRDNSDNAKLFHLTYNSFHQSLIQPLCNSTRYKNISTSLTKIIQPGAPS